MSKNTDTSRAIAQTFISRAKSQNMKGKARDRAATEFFIGAAAYAAARFGDKSPEWSSASIGAFLVATRGYAEVETLAKDVGEARASAGLEG